MKAQAPSLEAASLHARAQHLGTASPRAFTQRLEPASLRLLVQCLPTALLQALALSLLVSAALAAQQDATAPAQDPVEVSVVLHGEADEGSIAFGVAFELDLVRRWPEGATVPTFSREVLAPLVADELGVDTVTQDGRVVETRRFRARAFQRGGVTLLPRSANARTLLVDSCLPEGDAGVLELPPVPALAIRPARRAIAQALGVAGVAFAVAWIAQAFVQSERRRRARVPARTRLLRELAGLTVAVPIAASERRADAIAATRVSREATQRLRVVGAVRVAAGGAGPGAARDVHASRVAVAAPVVGAGPDVDALLAADRLLDEVKFAGRALDGVERAHALGVLRAAVESLPEDDA